jgi:hypothetical protein
VRYPEPLAMCEHCLQQKHNINYIFFKEIRQNLHRSVRKMRNSWRERANHFVDDVPKEMRKEVHQAQ